MTHYVAAWHDHDEYVTHIIHVTDNLTKAYKAITDKALQLGVPCPSVPNYPFDENHMWAEVNMENEVTFQITEIL